MPSAQDYAAVRPLSHDFALFRGQVVQYAQVAMRKEQNGPSRDAVQERLRAIARRISHYRELRGMSQTDLARRVGIHPSAISRLESGAIMPSVESLIRIALALGVGLGDLTGDPAKPTDLRWLLRNLDRPITYDGQPLAPAERERIVELIDTAMALRDRAEEPQADPSRLAPMQGPIAASMAEREAYGRHDPALNAFLQRVIQQALEEYDRKHGRPPTGRGPSSGG